MQTSFNRFDPPVEIDLRSRPDARVWICGIHLLALLSAFFAPSPWAHLFAGIAVVSAVWQLRQRSRCPWIRLIWYPSGGMELVDQENGRTPARFMEIRPVGSFASVLTLRIGPRCRRFFVARAADPVTYRHLLRRTGGLPSRSSDMSNGHRSAPRSVI